MSTRNGSSITDPVAPGQVSEHKKAPKKGSDRPQRWGTTAALSLQEPYYSESEWAAMEPRGSSGDPADERPEKVFSTLFRLQLALLSCNVRSAELS